MSNQLEIYFNTTDLKGAELKAREMRTGSQNKLILDFFKANPDRSFTPWDIVRTFGWPERMKVSAGRSITTLTKLGYLETTGEKRMETCREENNCWRLRC